MALEDLTRLTPDRERYQLGCDKWHLKKRVIKSKDTSIHQTASIVFDCHNRSHKNLGHPCASCNKWKPKIPGSPCPECRLHISWNYFEVLGSHSDKHITIKGKNADGPCPGCARTISAILMDNQLSMVLNLP